MTNKARLSFIFATILLDSLGIGILIPILPDVIRRFSSDAGFVSTYFGYFMASYALMQFVASPVLGRLSDRFGRRPVLLVSLLGAGVDYIIMAFAPSLLILFIGRVISGLTGASFTVASAYMADISDDSNRSANFGLIGAAFGLGFIIGPALGGLAATLGPQAPFVLAAALNLLNFAFGCFILPESLPESQRRSMAIKDMNPFRSIIRALRPSPIALMLVVFTLLYLAGHVHPSIWTLYTQTKFGWTATQVGFSLAVVGVTMAFSQGYLTGLLIPKMGESRALMLGLFVYITAFAAFAFASEGWMIYLILVPSALSGIAVPALQSMIAKHIPSSEQGELQGTIVSLGSLTAVAAPLLYTWLFAHFSDQSEGIHFLGAPYLCASLICVVATVITWRGMRNE